MNPLRFRPLQIVSSLVRVGALGCICSALVLGPAPQASAALLPLSFGVNLGTVSGSAANTITSLVFINDLTMEIEAEQVGHLTHFGNFTGQFSYLAVASPLSILLLGNATLTNDQGDQLFLTASILELGADYPRQVAGTLTVTGGSGRFAGATGSIAVSGVDGEDLTDTFKLAGTLLRASLN